MKKQTVTRLRASRTRWAAALVGATVCLVVIGTYVWRWWGATPYATVRRFAQAWERGDTATLYALMDDMPQEVIGMDSRRRPSREGFESLMKNTMFPIAPPGTRWQVQVTDPVNYNFRFKTEDNRHRMIVQVRRSVDGRWKVLGRDALLSFYLYQVYHGPWPLTPNEPVRQRFRVLWNTAGGHYAANEL